MTLLRPPDIARNDRSSEDSRTDDMVWIPGGTFRMGSDKHYPEEAPVHRVTVDGFWIDRTPVTNRQFKAFVKATGHVTFAEIPPDPKDYPGALPHMLYAGSLVFMPPPRRVDLRDWSQWWTFMKGADWRHPYGPKSNINVLDNHPVVHVCLSRCAGLRAMGRQGSADRSRMGIRRARRARRRRIRLGRRAHARRQAHGQHLAGQFPARRISNEDGYERTSPVTAFPPNGYGVHDMIGNVWEWTSDWYSPQARGRRAEGVLHPGKSARRPRGGQLRPVPAQHQDSAQGDQGRLASVRAELLPPLSPGGAACGGDRYLDQSSRIPVREEDCRTGIIVSPHSARRSFACPTTPRRAGRDETSSNECQNQRPQPSQHPARLVGAGGGSGDHLRRAGTGAEGRAAPPLPPRQLRRLPQRPAASPIFSSSGATTSASRTSVPTRMA